MSKPFEEIRSQEDACVHNESLGKATTKNQVAAAAGQGSYCVDSPATRQGRCQSDIQRLEKLRLDLFCCGGQLVLELSDLTSLLIAFLVG